MNDNGPSGGPRSSGRWHESSSFAGFSLEQQGLAVPGADFPGWGRAGLWETRWFMYSPKHHYTRAKGARCWPLIQETSFLFFVFKPGAVLTAKFSQLPLASSIFSCLFCFLWRSQRLEWLRSLLQPQVNERWALQQGNPCSTTSRQCCVCGIPQGATKKCSLQAGPQISSCTPAAGKGGESSSKNLWSWCSFQAACSIEEEVGNAPILRISFGFCQKMLAEDLPQSCSDGTPEPLLWNTFTAVLGLFPCQGRGIAAAFVGATGMVTPPGGISVG